MASLRLLFLRLSLLGLAIALGAPSVYAAEAVYPPGSRIGMVPPAGMVASNNFIGFEDASANAAIILAALPAEAYAELEKSVSADALKRQGVILEKRESMLLPTGKAFVVIGRQEIDKTKVRKWILIGSSSNLTALVTVQIPDSAKDVYSDATVRATLSTLAIRATVPVDEQLSLLPFRVAERAGFEIAGVMPGRAVVLRDAPADARPAPLSHIFVSIAPGGPSQTSARDTFASDLVAAIPNIREMRVATSESLRILGQPGHQILAQAKEPGSGTDLTIVQWLRFGGGAYLQMVGIARADAWRDAYPRFRAVRDGIEPR